jgi:stage II sporulation protein D
MPISVVGAEGGAEAPPGVCLGQGSVRRGVVVMGRLGRRLVSVAAATMMLLQARCDHPAKEESPARTADTSTTQPADGIDRSIRVLLADRLRKCETVVSGPFDLRDPDGTGVLVRGVSTPRLRVEFKDGRIIFPDLGQAYAAEAICIVPAGPNPVAVAIPEGSWRRYRGTLTVYLNADGTGAMVNTLDVEDYLVSVVLSESPSWFYSQALRAQAIVARTYAWYQKKTAPVWRRWDVLATEGSQVYAGLVGETKRSPAVVAVRATCGLVCTWDSPQGERIFCTYYSSTCGGSTQAAAPVKNESLIPPLAGNVRCDYCRHSSMYYWGPRSVSKKVMTERLRQRYPRFKEIGQIEQVKVIEETSAGRPVRLSLIDGQGQAIDLEAENLRLTVDPGGRELCSTFFKVANKGDDLVFYEGRGFGHGIGLCQYGADGLARAGASATYILRFYYPESHITHAY